MDLIRSDSVLGSQQVIAGSTDKNLVLQTKGKIKIQQGNVFIDLIKNGAINFPPIINIVDTLADIGKATGFYYVKATGKLYAVVDSSIVDVAGTVNNNSDDSSSGCCKNLKLKDLADVLLLNLKDGDILIYSGGYWVNSLYNINDLIEITKKVSNIESTLASQIDYTQRTYNDVIETFNMMFDPDGSYFTEKIKPLAVQTAQLIVGTNSQQFDFENINFRPNFNGDCNSFGANVIDTESPGLLIHYTIKLNSEDDYSKWVVLTNTNVDATSGLDYYVTGLDENSSYYLYAKCSRTEATGEFILTTDQILLESDPEYYYFWVGVLNKPKSSILVKPDEMDKSTVAASKVRSYQAMYGYTEISGNQITTGVIKDKAGKGYWDMINGAFKLGDSNSYIWYDSSQGRLFLKGSLTQVESGSIINPRWRGNYASGETYNIGDLVSYNNVLYIAKAGSTGVEPGTNSNYWDVYDSSSLYTAQIYIASETQPSSPTSTDVPPSGWSLTVPSGTTIWKSVARAIGTTAIEAWSAPVKYSGASGTDGVGTISLYQSAPVKPDAPTGTSTSPAGWSASMPTNFNKTHYLLYDGSTASKTIVVSPNATENIIISFGTNNSNAYISAYLTSDSTTLKGTTSSITTTYTNSSTSATVTIEVQFSSGCVTGKTYVWYRFENGNELVSPWEHFKLWGVSATTSGGAVTSWGEVVDMTSSDGAGKLTIYKAGVSQPTTPTTYDYPPSGWSKVPLDYNKNLWGMTAGTDTEKITFLESGSATISVDPISSSNSVLVGTSSGGSDILSTNYTNSTSITVTNGKVIYITGKNPAGTYVTVLITGVRYNRSFYAGTSSAHFNTLWYSEATTVGKVMSSSWSTPIRYTTEIALDGINGADGLPGAAGIQGPGLVYRGEWNSSTADYIHTDLIHTVVLYSGTYYLSLKGSYSSSLGGYYVEAGASPNASGSTWWQSFGASFTSIATGLLFANTATIGGWNFNNSIMWSNGKYCYINGGIFYNDTSYPVIAISDNEVLKADATYKNLTDLKSIADLANQASTFYVDKKGNMYANSGKIGPWLIQSDRLKYTGSDSDFGVTPKLYASNMSGEFNLDTSGLMLVGFAMDLSSPVAGSSSTTMHIRNVTVDNVSTSDKKTALVLMAKNGEKNTALACVGNVAVTGDMANLGIPLYNSLPNNSIGFDHNTCIISNGGTYYLPTTENLYNWFGNNPNSSKSYCGSIGTYDSQAYDLYVVCAYWGSTCIVSGQSAGNSDSSDSQVMGTWLRGKGVTINTNYSHGMVSIEPGQCAHFKKVRRGWHLVSL